ncbi:MAG: hypothetical protein WBG17_14010 [Burkholderiaceae bacterium]
MGGLIFLVVWLPLAAIGYAVLNLGCCGQSGSVTPGAWVVVTVATLLPALLAALLAVAVAEGLRRKRPAS